MALLSVENRKILFKNLGYGEYNAESIKKFQSDYMRAKDVDGKYGTNTDNTLRHVYNVKKYTKDFSPQEFKCECGGKYCCGYPTYMKPSELVTLQAIRDHFGKAMTITCGLRCKAYNKTLPGSASNSLHLYGQAADYYIAGVTDTLAHRTNSIAWIKGLKYHRYSYGNGINSNGGHPNTPNMGNAMHTDCNDVPVDGDGGYDYTIDVDGAWGTRTTITTQHVLGCKEDGALGTETWKAIQNKVGTEADGAPGPKTYTAMAQFLGIAGKATTYNQLTKDLIKAWQEWLNKSLNPEPSPTPEPEPEPTPSGGKYTGQLPDIHVTKTAEQVRADAVAWGKNIAANNRYHYGEYGPKKYKGKAIYNVTHHSGCHFCNTNYSRKVVRANKLGYKGENWECTYVCNTFTTACYAHGGQVKQFYDKCHKGSCIGMDSGGGKNSILEKSSEWKNLGKISCDKMLPGDLVFSTSHAQMYAGKSSTKKAKIVEATSYDGNYGNAASKNSIRVIDKNPSYTCVYRFIGKVDRNIPIEMGELSDRVKLIQTFLNWYGSYGLVVDGDFQDATKKAVMEYQKKEGLVVDGIFGSASLQRAKEVSK